MEGLHVTDVVGPPKPSRTTLPGAKPRRNLIRESARKEYEAARFEKDPQIINKLIISGRDCLEKSLQNVIDKQREIVEQQRRTPGGGPFDSDPRNNPN